MITLLFTAELAAAVLATSFISGIFGMAGGMILIAVLMAIMPLTVAMVLHGITQLTANSWRAWIWWSAIRWRIAAFYAAGALTAALLVGAVELVPSKPGALITLALLSFAGLCVPRALAPDIRKSGHGVCCGFLCTVLQLTAGVSGPVLDVFFVRSGLDRRQTVATKAAIQALGHFLKVVYFGQLLVAGTDVLAPTAVALAITLAAIGTQLSRRALDAISDTHFMRWSRWLIVATAATCLIQGMVQLGTDLGPFATPAEAAPGTTTRTTTVNRTLPSPEILPLGAECSEIGAAWRPGPPTQQLDKSFHCLPPSQWNRDGLYLLVVSRSFPKPDLTFRIMLPIGSSDRP